MTRTEERLADALQAAANTIRLGALRPLTPHDPERLRGERRTRRGHRGLLAPIGAAIAVSVVAAVSVAIAGHGRHAPTVPLPVGLPRYYVVLHDNPPGARSPGEVIEVRDTATGRVRDTLALTVRLGDHSYNGNSGSLAAAGQRTFFVWYEVLRPGPHAQAGTRLYRFRLTRSGHITAFAPVASIASAPWDIIAIAASRDGGKVALTLGWSGVGRRPQPAIMVVNTATGSRALWRGAFQDPARTTLGSPSWARDGRTLGFQVFASKHNVLTTEVRTLATSTPGRGLADSHLVMRKSGDHGPSGAVISPDGATFTALILRTSEFKPQQTPSPAPTSANGIRLLPPPRIQQVVWVVQFSAANGRQLRVLYQQGPGDGDGGELRADSSGHLLLNSGHEFGWIDGGRLHWLPYGSDLVDFGW